MTIETRKPAINNTKAREIYRRDKTHRVYAVTSLVSGKPYQVVSDWSIHDSVVTIDCKLFSFEAKYFQFQHPANFSKTICCQFLASVKEAAQMSGKILSLPEDGEYTSAKRLLNLGGNLVRIRNQNGEAWGTVR